MILTYAALPCCCCYRYYYALRSQLPPHSSPCLLRDPCSLPRSLSLSPLPCLHANDAMPCAPPLSTIHHKRRPAQLNYCMILFLFLFFIVGLNLASWRFFSQNDCVCVCVFAASLIAIFFKKRFFLEEKLSCFSMLPKMWRMLELFPFHIGKFGYIYIWMIVVGKKFI